MTLSCKALGLAVCTLSLLAPWSLLAQASQPVGFSNTLMPLPREIRVAGTPVVLTSGFTASLQSGGSPVLEAAVMRALGRIESQTGIELGRGLRPAGGATLEIAVADLTATRPTLETDESYSLEVGEGRIRLNAPTVFGAMHGLETLLQLLEPQGGAFVFPAVHIADQPRFAWRGLLLDPGRRFLSVAEILRTLDAMAAVKLNVLHWHLTEDQGFRIESLRFPRLHQLGSDGKFYTQLQVREIVAYASARGIRVVPEFDMPGHSSSWLVGYPELAAQPGPYQVQHENRIFNAVLDPTRESTFEFLDAFFAEMAGLFPDEYVHIGGDESNGKDWRANPAIVQFMQQHHLADTNALQAYFNTRVQRLLAQHGKKMAGWDEILQPDLPPGVLIQSWRGTRFVADAARAGRTAILSQPWYLDHMYTAAQMYAADPLPADSTLTPDQAKLVLGGEACMWGEQVSDLSADSRIWPRSAAVAERLWSPATARDPVDMYRRLAVTSLRLDALGVTHMSTPERGLRQLAGSQAGGQQLGVFASVLQPVDFHERFAEQHTSPLTPIGQLVDFTVPDPPARERIETLVSAYLRDTDPAARQTEYDQLTRMFRRWVDVAPALEVMAQQSPLLAEVHVRRAQFPQLGQLGLEALGFLQEHRPAPAAWTEAQRALLKTAAGHTELVDFVQIDALRRLVSAAAGERVPD